MLKVLTQVFTPTKFNGAVKSSSSTGSKPADYKQSWNEVTDEVAGLVAVFETLRNQDDPADLSGSQLDCMNKSDFLIQVANGKIEDLGDHRGQISFGEKLDDKVVIEDVCLDDLAAIIRIPLGQLKESCPYLMDSIKNEIQTKRGTKLTEQEIGKLELMKLPDVMSYNADLELKNYFKQAISLTTNGKTQFILGTSLVGMQNLIYSDALHNRAKYEKSLNQDALKNHRNKLSQFIKANLEKIGTADFDENNLDAFKKIYNLKNDNLTIGALQRMPKLTSAESKKFSEMRSDSVHSGAWNPNNDDCLFRTLALGFSDGACAMYKCIFTREVMADCVELADKLPDTELFPVDQKKPYGERHGEITLSSGKRVRMREEAQSNGIVLEISEEKRTKTERLSIYPDKTSFTGEIGQKREKHPLNYEQFFSKQALQERNNRLMPAASKNLQTIVQILQAPSKHDKTHQQQIERDYSGSEDCYVQIGAREAVSHTKLITFNPTADKDRLTVDDAKEELSVVQKNLLMLMLDQRYRMVFGRAFESLGKLDKTSYTVVLPDDFEKTHQIVFKGKVTVNALPIEWEGTLKLSDDFCKKLESDAFLQTNELGVESAEFTNVEYTSAKKNKLADKKPEETPQQRRLSAKQLVSGAVLVSSNSSRWDSGYYSTTDQILSEYG